MKNVSVCSTISSSIIEISRHKAESALNGWVPATKVKLLTPMKSLIPLVITAVT